LSEARIIETQSTFPEDQTSLILNLSVKFDYTCQEAFQKAFEAANPLPQRNVIDALEVHSIDSSVLGMQLLLRNHAGED
jgi:anti-anti-sigma regulatory factor